jgi:hypothetical protein
LNLVAAQQSGTTAPVVVGLVAPEGVDAGFDLDLFDGLAVALFATLLGFRLALIAGLFRRGGNLVGVLGGRFFGVAVFL